MELVKSSDFGIEEKKAEEITKGLKPILDERKSLEQQYEDIIGKEITPKLSKAAKELRLEIQKNRTQGIKKWHKVNKEFYLRGGQFVDAINRKEIAHNEAMENNLKEIEEHELRLERERIQKLNEERRGKVMPYANEMDIVPENLGEMSADVWNNYFEGMKANYERREKERKEAEKEEAERLRVEKLHNERREYLIENDLYRFHNKENSPAEENYLGKKDESSWIDLLNQLEEDKKIDLEEREADRLAAEQREKELEKERKEKAKLEKQIKDKEEAERKAAEEAEKQKELEAKKGDSAKVKDLIQDLESIKGKYTFKSKSNQKMFNEVEQLIDKVINHVKG